MTKISVVIPTRNRAKRMIDALSTLEKQILQPSEIIVVDSSDDTSYHHTLSEKFPALPLKWITSVPSVCIQRNLGIRQASCEWILLCDDDIELDPNYLDALVNHIIRNPDCGALAGRLMQKEHGAWTCEYPVKNFYDLIWRFFFQHSIWGGLDRIKISTWQRPMFTFLKKWYSKRENTMTTAGWPLITDWSGDHFCTKFYSLGANLILRDWLLRSPYDEVLDPSGIGDNYGVACGFPGYLPVHVLAATHAYHHRAEENRIARKLSHYRRTLALHYFLKRNNAPMTRLWFRWSLFGKILAYLFKRDWELLTATIKAMGLISIGLNPYWTGYRKGRKVVRPLC